MRGAGKAIDLGCFWGLAIQPSGWMLWFCSLAKSKQKRGTMLSMAIAVQCRKADFIIIIIIYLFFFGLNLSTVQVKFEQYCKKI